jgi:hypothetical protein
MSQKERIKKYSYIHHTITPKQAEDKFGVMRLGARIWELKHDGLNIVTEKAVSTNRYGKKVTYAKYRLVK